MKPPGFAGGSTKFNNSGIEMLILDVFGFESNSGQSVIAIFSESKWELPPNPGRAGIIDKIEIVDQAVYLELSGLSEGRYVAILLSFFPS